MNKERKGNNLSKERWALSLLSGSLTEACVHGQVDSSDLAWCAELFKCVLASLSWVLLKMCL